MTCKERHETPTKYRPEHPRAAVKPGAISDPSSHGQGEVDSPSRRSRTPRHRIRLSAEDVARVQREAWSDVETAEEKRTEGAWFFGAFCSQSSQ